MQTGIFTKTFSRPTLELVLDAVRATGLSCVQLNLESAGLEAFPAAIPAGLAERIHDAVAERGLSMGAVQGTFNMSHPDSAHRREGLRRLRLLVEACAKLGTFVVAICIGTRDADNMWRHHPDNGTPEAWRDMTGCVREALHIAADQGVTLAMEPEVSNVVDSARTARRLLDEMGSPYLKVTMDGANLFPAGSLPRMAEVLDEAFALLGPDIILAHAKDLDRDGDAGQLPAGKGLLDYDRYVSLLKGCGFTGPILFHGLAEEDVPGCITFLHNKLEGGRD